MSLGVAWSSLRRSPHSGAWTGGQRPLEPSPWLFLPVGRPKGRSGAATRRRGRKKPRAGGALSRLSRSEPRLRSESAESPIQSPWLAPPPAASTRAGRQNWLRQERAGRPCAKRGRFLSTGSLSPVLLGPDSVPATNATARLNSLVSSPRRTTRNWCHCCDPGRIRSSIPTSDRPLLSSGGLGPPESADAVARQGWTGGQSGEYRAGGVGFAALRRCGVPTRGRAAAPRPPRAFLAGPLSQ